VLITAASADDTWNGTPVNLNASAIFGEGLREGFTNVADDETTANPVNGPDNGQGAGISLGLREAQSTTFGATAWANTRTWIYTGEVFTGPNGVFSFAANNDDDDWLKINGTVVLNDNGWDTAVATTVTGLTPNTWVPFEYRVADNGAGGAGPSGQNNPAGAANWNGTTGAVASWNNENGSLDANAYIGGTNDLGKPTETANGTPDLFRYLITPATQPNQIVHVTATGPTNVTLGGNVNLIQEQSISFETATGAVHIIGGSGRTLQFTSGGTVAGNQATFDIDAATTVQLTGNLGGTAAGKLVKSGAGTLTLSGNNQYGGGITVSGGIFESPSIASLGANAITLNGGTLRVVANPSGALTGEYWDNTVGGDGGAQAAFGGNLAAVQAYFAAAPKNNTPIVTAPTNTGGKTALDWNSVTTAPFADQGFNGVDNIAVRMSGTVNIFDEGSYNFSTESDDGSVLFIDGVKVADNNFYQGMTVRGGNIFLEPGAHQIVIGFYEGGGGAGLKVRYTPPGGSNQLMSNSLFGAPATTTDTFNVSGTSGLDLNSTSTNVGALTLASGSTFNVSKGNIKFASTTLSGTAGTFNINKDGGFFRPGLVTATGATTINKTGTGSLALEDTAGQFPAGSIVNVNAGALTLLGTNLLGGPTINVAATAALQLSSTGGDKTYTLPIGTTLNFIGDDGVFRRWCVRCRRHNRG
jgi:autotransporter-associated beta strand protein